MPMGASMPIYAGNFGYGGAGPMGMGMTALGGGGSQQSPPTVYVIGCDLNLIFKFTFDNS